MIEGDMSPWSDSFPAGLVPVVLDLLLTLWPALEHTSVNEHETSITRRFRALLRQSRDARQLPFLIEREVPIDDQASSGELGRLDLKFIHGHREEVYLTFEGKRVNVVDANGSVHRRTSEYVSEGMMRFVRGQYAGGLREGGMLAYVMDGDRTAAEGALHAIIVARRGDLCLLPLSGLDESDIRRGDVAVRQTRHDLTGRPFRIHHLLLTVSR